MASGPITSWQIDGETMETVRDFIFLNSKITADGVLDMHILKSPRIFIIDISGYAERLNDHGEHAYSHHLDLVAIFWHFPHQ